MIWDQYFFASMTVCTTLSKKLCENPQTVIVIQARPPSSLSFFLVAHMMFFMYFMYSTCFLFKNVQYSQRSFFQLGWRNEISYIFYILCELYDHGTRFNPLPYGIWSAVHHMAGGPDNHPMWRRHCRKSIRILHSIRIILEDPTLFCSCLNWLQPPILSSDFTTGMSPSLSLS